VERKLAAWPEIGQAVGLAGSRVMSAVVDVWGWKARFALARGQTIADVIARLPAIESALGTYRGAVRAYPTADDLANRFELRVLDRDPHADAIAWPGPSISSISEPVEFGPFEDAEPCRVLLLRRHALIGGVSGSGKSGGLNVLMGNLTACDDVVIWAIDLKRGMELRPWASCIARLATTGSEAEALLADAIAVLEARAEMLAAVGKRVWEPSAIEPALVIVVDEYAELADAADAAVSYADSIARRGRAVAVTLVAATQRPTQKAMGQGTLRSQMDVRMSFRVRERRDVDLILGQGMLAAGWQAHTLNAPGKFLISAPEHDTPRRARCYLVSDDDVAFAAAGQAPYRPTLDAVSLAAIAQTNPDEPKVLGVPADADIDGTVLVDDRGTPVTMLWAALSLAPPDGATVPELTMASGMSRPWVYQRLADLVRAGQVYQTSRGRWRAVPDGFR
jgi:S-DNA-T family DNA segregation ATPase FtsK/SpoIIIE